MIQKQIKTNGVIEFNDYFLSRKLFDFKDMFKEKPEIETTGDGKNLFVKITYTHKFNEDEKKKFFIGSSNLKDLKDRGIFFNEAFAEEFNLNFDSGENKPDDELSEGDDENTKNKTPESDETAEDAKVNKSLDDELAESIESIYFNNIINEGLFGSGRKNKKIELPFKEDDALDLMTESFSVIFEFDKVNYCQNFKNKEQFNLNRLSGMTGNIFFKFGDMDPIKVTEEGGVDWKQKRTSDMDPQKSVRQEMKERWNNPNQGFGLLGLAAKKLVGGPLKNAILGPAGAEVIQEADFSINFLPSLSKNNMEGLKSKASLSKRTKEKQNETDKIESILISNNGENDLDWIVEKKINKEYECKAEFNGIDILKITIKL